MGSSTVSDSHLAVGGWVLDNGVSRVKTMGFNRSSFQDLLQQLQLHWVRKRKRVFAIVDVLGLVLHWTNSTMGQQTFLE